jgi:hypothetical protein
MNRPRSTHEKDGLIRLIVKETDGMKPREEPNNRLKINIKLNLQEVRFCKNVFEYELNCTNVFEYELNCTVIKPLLACL